MMSSNKNKEIKKISPAESRKSKHQFYIVELIDGKNKGKKVRVGERLKNTLVSQKRGKVVSEDKRSNVEG